MTPYYSDDSVTVYSGNCLDVMRDMPDASVDSVVTDPPYGLEFMGKEWDGADGFRRSLNAADVGRESVFGRASRTSPEYRTTGRAADMNTFQEWCTEWSAECLRVLKPGGHMLAFGGSRTWHRLASGIEDAGFDLRDSIAWLYGSGFPKSLNLSDSHSGWGTALKPAFEPVVVARKPLVGTVAQNVTQYGTGALNIDGCRTGTEERTNQAGGSSSLQRVSRVAMGYREKVTMSVGESSTVAGRWPTNVVLDEDAAVELDQQTGILTSGKPGIKRGGNTGPAYGAESRPPGTQMSGYGDSGGASRFFPVFKYTAKAGSDERPEVDGVRHPTVKPIDLMRWLIRLVTPPNGLILDPFAGSGTTGEAAVLEHMRAILIEREPDYLPLIMSRLSKPMAIGFDFGEAVS